jgi:hypothetical protein
MAVPDNSVVSLLKSKQLFHLSNHESFWDVVVVESFHEFSPSDFMSSRLHRLKSAPTTLRARLVQLSFTCRAVF